ncbi:MAG TPA: APC family permease [bacterium]|jgi:amino acid transporter|nr:APC family permease [bacterium]
MSPADQATKIKQTHMKLKTNALNFWEVLAQSVALISPSMTACLIVPLMFGTAGSMGWFCFLFGAVMLLFVALGLNQFAKRSAAAGSMYEYTVKGLGPKVGGMSGWSLLWAYMFIGIAGVTGFTHFASLLLTQGGFDAAGHVNILWIPMFGVCVGASWLLAILDITVSTVLMLLMEGVSVFIITSLCLYAMGQTGFVDAAQLHPFAGLNFAGIMKPLGLGVVVAVFSEVGFEAATAFGEESKKPLINIPKAVIASLLLTGLFFIFVTYVETHALATNKPTLDQLTAPLVTLSNNLGVGWLGTLTSLGAMVSFFALAMSCLNSGARIMFTMGRYGIFPISVGSSHKTNLTPHIALSIFGAIQFLIPTVVMLLVYAGNKSMAIAAPFDIFNDAGLFGAMGFCCAYVLISLAAPFYLKKIGELKAKDVLVAVTALVLLLVPIIGPFWPVPAAPPTNYFPYIVGTYLLVGAVLIYVRSHTSKEFERITGVITESSGALEAGLAVESKKKKMPVGVGMPELG